MACGAAAGRRLVREVRRQAARGAVGRAGRVEGPVGYRSLTLRENGFRSPVPCPATAIIATLQGVELKQLGYGNLKDLAYTVYSRRVTGLLKGKPKPLHVGVMCDG